MLTELLGNLCGFIAAVAIAIYLIPQCLYMMRQKSSAGVSMWTVVLAAVGDVSGVIHMLLIIDWDMWLALRQLGVGAVSTWLLVLYFRYR